MAKLVSFSRKRLEYAMEFYKKYIDGKMSVNAISKEVISNDVIDKESTFRRYKRIEKMPEEMLKKVQDLLNVSTKYLTGEWNEKAPAFISVSDFTSMLQGNDIIARRTDPDGVYILPSDNDEREHLLSEAVMQTQHYINTTHRRYYDSKTEAWIEYSNIFDSQSFFELHRIIEKILQTAAAQQLSYHPDHISLGAIFKQIESEPAEITTIKFE